MGNKRRVLWVVGSFLLLLLAACGKPVGNRADKLVGQYDGEEEATRVSGGEGTLATSSGDVEEPQLVMVGSVPDNWAKYVPHMLERQGIEVEGRWTDSNKDYELWIDEYYLEDAAAFLMADSHLNGYVYAPSPEFAEEHTEHRDDLINDWESFSWTETLEIEDGQYRVRIEVEDFRPHRHTLSWTGDEQKQITSIDGRSAYGVWHLVPPQRVRSVEFSYQGRSIPIAEDLWSDCYSPNLKRAILDSSDFVHMTEVDGGVDVVLMGADGAAGYFVTWHLRNDGDHSRSILIP